MKSTLALAALCAVVLASTTACAEPQMVIPVSSGEPVVNIGPQRHGNLASAQHMVREAYDRLSDAQVANDSRLGGHADRAKELLREANEELKLAAITANHH